MTDAIAIDSTDAALAGQPIVEVERDGVFYTPVSYTHLTLPTICSV